MPGTYQVRLTVAGRPYRQAVIVRMDPRVKAPLADLRTQFTLSKALDDSMRQIARARMSLPDEQSGVASGQVAVTALETAYDRLSDMFARVQQSDTRPTAVLEAAAANAIAEAEAALQRVR
jgi:hypothetical protein